VGGATPGEAGRLLRHTAHKLVRGLAWAARSFTGGLRALLSKVGNSTWRRVQRRLERAEALLARLLSRVRRAQAKGAMEDLVVEPEVGAAVAVMPLAPPPRSSPLPVGRVARRPLVIPRWLRLLPSAATGTTGTPHSAAVEGGVTEAPQGDVGGAGQAVVTTATATVVMEARGAPAEVAVPSTPSIYKRRWYTRLTVTYRVNYGELKKRKRGVLWRLKSRWLTRGVGPSRASDADKALDIKDWKDKVRSPDRTS
jgi:hypothetical protein